MNKMPEGTYTTHWKILGIGTEAGHICTWRCELSCRDWQWWEKAYFSLLSLLLFPWLRHISILNHNCGEAHAHLTPTYVNPFLPRPSTMRERKLPILWKRLGWNVRSPSFSRSSRPSDTPDKVERDIYPSKMEPFAREAEFWSKLMVSGKKYLISRASSWAPSLWLFIKWRWKGNL